MQVFVDHGASALKLFRGFAERALAGGAGGAQYNTIVAVYEQYGAANSGALLKGMSTDMVVRPLR